MFENFSQSIFFSGGILYSAVIPLLRFAAGLFMAAAVYKKLRRRGDNHKVLWVLFALTSPVLAWICYALYCHFIPTEQGVKVRQSLALSLTSVGLFAISAILAVVAVVLMGAGAVKSEIDGEPLFSYYDAQGNSYSHQYDVPIYDSEGNEYTYNAEWFTFSYIDKNGEEPGSIYYIGEDGKLYYGIGDTLKEYDGYSDYYTDGERIYYEISDVIHWDKYGTMYEGMGKHTTELFRFD